MEVEEAVDRAKESVGTAEEARRFHEAARAYLRVERAEKARVHFFRSKRADFAGSLAAENARGLGEAYLVDGLPSAAEGFLREAAERGAPGRARDEALLLRALALERLERREEAAAARASIVHPSDPALALLERRYSPPPPLPPSPVPRAPTNGSHLLAALPRSAWRAARVRADVKAMGAPYRITVHHTARLFSDETEVRTAAEIRGIQNDHQNRAGWADIGYHFVVDRAGRLWQARPLGLQGAHAGNDAANRGNIGICLLGNFEVQRPAPSQLGTLRALLDHLTTIYGIPPNAVFTHREVRPRYGLGYTDCPGQNLQTFVEGLRRSELSPGSRGAAATASFAR